MTKIEKKYKWLVVNGVYYEIDLKDGKPLFEKVSKTTVDERIKKAKKLAKELGKGLNKEMLLTELILTSLEDKEFENLYKLIFYAKRKYKPKTRKHHCVDMKIGNFVLPLKE